MNYHFNQNVSKKFWLENEEKINQHLYVSLCLYQSACSDFVTSLDLHKDERYTWSIVTSYYSILHSLRTIIFLAVGDFPKEHSLLEKIFFEKQDSTQTNQYIGRSWLKKFDPTYPGIRRNLEYFNRIHLAQYFEDILNFDTSNVHFSKIGSILEIIRKIRTDSNYETLISAHEKRHIVVSNNFIRLTKSILKASEYCISIATKCIKHFIEFSEEFEINRNKIRWFSYEFLLTRFDYSLASRTKRRYLKNKVQKFSRSIIKSFFEKGFAEIKDTFLEDFEIIERNISLEVFGKKRNLMEKFEGRVNQLEELITKLRIVRD